MLSTFLPSLSVNTTLNAVGNTQITIGHDAKITNLISPPRSALNSTRIWKVSSRAAGKLSRHWRKPSPKATPAPCPPSQLAIFQSVEKPLIKLRQDYLSGVLQFPHVIPFLGAVDFLETTARTLDKCVDQLRSLKLEAYSGDYAL